MKKIILTLLTALLSFSLFAQVVAEGTITEIEGEGIVVKYKDVKAVFVKIPKKNFAMMKTEVPQGFYTSIMGSNPSYFKGSSNPVERVNWFDAIYFCNKLSEKIGLTPVYSVNGKTNPEEWGFIPHEYKIEYGSDYVPFPIKTTDVKYNEKANGFRLPDWDEWHYAASCGDKYHWYSGNDDDPRRVAWFSGLCTSTKIVGTKKPNDYGLYDMCGNVAEWIWDNGWDSPDNSNIVCGGSWGSSPGPAIYIYGSHYGTRSYARSDTIGFRIVYSIFD